MKQNLSLACTAAQPSLATHSLLGLPLKTKKTALHAKPSQAKVLTGGGDLREAQADIPCLLAIPA